MKMGEKEQTCLDSVRNILRTKKCNKYLDEDVVIIENILTAKENEQANDFPDFICKNGFIEHFQVSASGETKKGSLYKQEESCFERQSNETLVNKKDEYLNSIFEPNTLTTYENTLSYDKSTYENYVQAFKKNFESHIDSLKKYHGSKENGTFLIEQVDGSLFIDGAVPYKPYSLSIDKELLQYVYQYKDYLTYVLFTDGESCEIIKLSLIPKILSNVKDGIKFKAGRMTSTNLLLCVDIDLEKINE